MCVYMGFAGMFSFGILHSRNTRVFTQQRCQTTSLCTKPLCARVSIFPFENIACMYAHEHVHDVQSVQHALILFQECVYMRCLRIRHVPGVFIPLHHTACTFLRVWRWRRIGKGVCVFLLDRSILHIYCIAFPVFVHIKQIFAVGKSLDCTSFHRLEQTSNG